MSSEEDRQLVVIAALIRKLGGEVSLTDQDLREAEEMEIQSFDDPSFSVAVRYRVRPKPVTVVGEVVDERQEWVL